jgi:ribosomal protein S18 acetylase RimI-like enzyme
MVTQSAVIAFCYDVSLFRRRRICADSARRPRFTTAFIEHSTLTIHIRPATIADAPLILRFITELAVYEKAEHEVVAGVKDIEKSLFCAGAPAKALICEMNGEPVGFCVYFFSYSTWLGKQGLYLEDLYVSPASRGSGAGKQMLRHLAQIACETGCGRFEWSVLDWNEPAIGFYKSIGANPQSEWVRYRLAGDALKAFAEGKTEGNA